MRASSTRMEYRLEYLLIKIVGWREVDRENNKNGDCGLQELDLTWC